MKINKHEKWNSFYKWVTNKYYIINAVNYSLKNSFIINSQSVINRLSSYTPPYCLFWDIVTGTRNVFTLMCGEPHVLRIKSSLSCGFELWKLGSDVLKVMWILMWHSYVIFCVCAVLCWLWCVELCMRN